MNLQTKKSELSQTCHKSLKKGHLPAPAVSNKLYVPFQPADLKNLNRLERVLISRKSFIKKDNYYCQKVVFQN